MFDPADLTCDGFLGGRLTIAQPRTGYRAATDPVLLAAAVQAAPGARVLELGCGVGVASLCLLARQPALSVTGIERQPAYAALARQNSEQNKLPLHVVEADLAHLPKELRAQTFDHVIANPPFFASGQGTAARNPGREAAFREETALATWIDVALRRLAPGGWLTMIHLAERLPDMLGAIQNRAGSVAILPIAPRTGRPASRVILCARKASKAPMQLLAPLILHDGLEHLQDGDDYSAAARAILRDGAPISAFSVRV